MAEGERHLATLALVDAGVWLGLSVVVGFAGARVPAQRFAGDGPLTRLRSFERDGRRWEAIGVRRWKDRLPEAGSLFGGMSKRRLGPAPDLERLVRETRRAELVHWALVAAAPLFALWNPPALTLAMGTYAVAANAPCIIVQRYNRARGQRILARRDRRVTPAGGDRTGPPDRGDQAELRVAPSGGAR